MFLKEFLEQTKNLKGDTKIYISNMTLGYTKDNIDAYQTFCHKSNIGTDTSWIYCDVIWDFNFPLEKLNVIETGTLFEIRGHSFDITYPDTCQLVYSHNENASGFSRFKGYLFKSRGYYQYDVIILY